jgi:hypothetical protein
MWLAQGWLSGLTHLSSSSHEPAKVVDAISYTTVVSRWPGGHVRTSRIAAGVQDFLFSRHFGLELLAISVINESARFSFAARVQYVLFSRRS